MSSGPLDALSMSSMPLKRRLANHSPNGRKGLELFAICGFCRNMPNQSNSSPIRRLALSPLNFTVCSVKTWKPCQTWAGLPPFGPPTQNSRQSQPLWRNTSTQASLVVLMPLGSSETTTMAMHQPLHCTTLPPTRRILEP
jgi:hypothetical protein